MKKIVGICVCLFLLASACDDPIGDLVDQLPGHDDDEIRAAVMGMQQGSLEAALLAALTADASYGSEAEMATAVQAQVGSVFEPSACVQSIATGDAVSLTFEECNGPYGLIGLQGAANLTFSIATDDSVGVLLTSGSIDLNGTSLAVNISGEMRDENGNRVYDLVTSGGGVASGQPITRTGQFRSALDDNCLVMDGGWAVTIGESVYPTTFARFTRCDGACPSDGTMVLGSVEVDGVESDERAITLTFVGSETVAWVSTDMRGGTTSLSCE